MKPWILAAHLVAAMCALQGSGTSQDEARMLRFPHRQGDKIAFVYGGDLWAMTLDQSVARRLTSYDEGYELFPRISPDGQWVAFSGEYTGTRQIYVMPFTGGEPRQLTFYPDVGPMPPRGGYDHLPWDWSADSSKILIKANRTPYGQRVAKYFWVDAANPSLPDPLQIPEGGPVSLAPDGRKLAYNIISREWRTWKRYQAGRAQDVYIYDLQANTIQQITDHPGTDNFPMWLGSKIYFTSDRTGTLNLYRYDLNEQTTTAITEYTDFDVLFPSRGNGGLIFERGGFLYTMEASDESIAKVEVRFPDDKPWLRPQWVEPAAASYALSPEAKRVVVEVRGEVFDVPAEHGRARNITATPERREREVRWSPDGRWISYLAEDGDDYELFLYDVAEQTERQVTDATGSWILQTTWSPDSTSIAWTDKQHRLWVYRLDSDEHSLLDQAEEDAISSPAWSADSRWLTYSKLAENNFQSIWICPANTADPRQVTVDHYDDHSPCFDQAGDYLFFVSARDFSFSDLSFDSRLYALCLRQDVASPLAPRNDEFELKKKDEETESAARPDAEEATAETETTEPETETEDEALTIDFDGLIDRLVALPGAPGNYFNLETANGGFLYVHSGDLKKYDIEERDSSTVLEGVGGYMLSPDRSKLVYRHDRGLCIASVSPGQEVGANPIQLDDAKLRVDPRLEWPQIYRDCWRIMRDWFYDPNLHGVDWTAMREKYAPLVDHVAHRDDLDAIMGELIGELNAGHTYVFRGESPRVERVPVGLLGCEFAKVDGHYQFTKIYRGRGWHDAERSPLAATGVDVQEGEFLWAIDGKPVTTAINPYQLLENTVGRQITLTVADNAGGENKRDVVVRPVASEGSLRYLDWVERNRQLVDEWSEGQIGYVHAPNTAVQGHRELYEGFLPQARVKRAMIIDDRYNGGGFIPVEMIQLLTTPVLNYWSRRNSQLGSTPAFGFEGPMAMLINGYSSSGGDAFPYYFRKTQRGPLIGKTTWGGLIGYSGSPNMVDGGGLAVPMFSFVNTDGEWDVEAVGVAPDIEVFDDPTRIQRGEEPILRAAVDYLLKQLAETPTPERPATPEGPQRNS